MMAQALIAELEHEAASTRKILERVPFDKWDWKPHPKSMSLGRLAVHVAEITGWTVPTLEQDSLDFSKEGYKPYQPKDVEDLLKHFDETVAKAKACLQAVSPEEFGKPWTLRNGDTVYFTLPKAAVVRSFAFNHQVHHRAQLGVYLRLLDIPVPGMYGPTADEQ